MHIAIIGGGAAGFFAALSVKQHYPNAQVSIFEKSTKVLSKVRISGGGRCNVTNVEPSISGFSKNYPRGKKILKKAFHNFGNKETINWFSERGVSLVAEQDGRMFPSSNTSAAIIDCFLKECHQLSIDIHYKMGLTSFSSTPEKVCIFFNATTKKTFDKAIIATGGAPKKKQYDWLSSENIAIEAPVPSLFTFNIPKNPISTLMGLVASNALVAIQGTKLSAQGPLLITHWGMSGPAILKLSAFGARILEEKQYRFSVAINWIGQRNIQEVEKSLKHAFFAAPKKKIQNIQAFELPNRLWLFLLEKAGISVEKLVGEIGQKILNKLLNILCNDVYKVEGKTTFKEEFVTCGGVSLTEINPTTMQHKMHKNMYFAGEVLDIDGITGGYNFQSCWTTGYLAGKLLD